MEDDIEEQNIDGECVIPSHPVSPQKLSRYSVDGDIHLQQDIANYVEVEANDETVQHVELIKKEAVLGDLYTVWDVITDKNRWWVITNPTNLYSQEDFPSLDYTLSFHIGLMMRVRSRSNRVDNREVSPFDEVFRRLEQAGDKHDTAVEVEDYQVVGMLLRECLISLVAVLRRRAQLPQDLQRPQDANFVAWSDILMNHFCGGGSNKELRQHLKNTAKETWQLANWLTHARSAGQTASSVAIHACHTVVGHFISVLERERTDHTDSCPVCKSRDIRRHYDITIPPDGDYYLSCGVCDWNNYPTVHKT